jgi:uncharacterized protein (TIGR03118 family)
MNGYAASKTLALAAISVGALCAGAWRAEAGPYVQTDLVSNMSGLATLIDPNLVNPWGVSFLPGSPFWISDQGANSASLFPVAGSTGVTRGPFTVSIPTTSPTPPQGPTGQVANPGTSFDIAGGPALFIFANLNGTISAWNLNNAMMSPNASTVVATTAGALYTGLAINKADTMLYAANGATGGINVFNSSFGPTTAPGGFVDPNLPSGLIPFNVEDIGGKVYVTYAPATRALQQTAPAGTGVVDVFDENGNFLQRLITGSALAAPWGMALAPSNFGQFSGDLLVGNFSFVDSGINAFNPTTGAFIGTIPIDPGLGNTAGGLWDLTFGGGGSGSPTTLFFTDGINGENDGLFGAIQSIPEPSTWALMLAGFVGLGLLAAARRRRSPATIV